MDRLSGQALRYPLPSEAVNTVKKRKLSLIGLLAPYWKPFAVGIGAVLIEALADLLQPWPLKIVVDLVGQKRMPPWIAAWVASLFGTDKLAVLNFVAFAVIMIAALGAVSSYVESLSMTTVGQWVTHDLRS